MSTIDVHPMLPEPALIRRVALAGAALLIVAVLSLALVVPAEAHSTSTVLPGDGSYAWMTPDHQVLAGCDMQSDGHRAYLRRFDIWGSQYPTVYDPDGAGGECALVLVQDWPLGSYNICVQYEGCGSPVYRWQF